MPCNEYRAVRYDFILLSGIVCARFDQSLPIKERIREFIAADQRPLTDGPDRERSWCKTSGLVVRRTVPTCNAVPVKQQHVFWDIFTMITLAGGWIGMSAVIWSEYYRMVKAHPATPRGFRDHLETLDVIRNCLKALA